jgi:type VII secretion protein EccB
VQNRRDHVQAHRFATGRLVSALVAGDPGPVEVPMRRGSLGTQFGALLAVLLAAGAAVFGLMSPGENTAWRKPGTIVVEKETGNRYLFFGSRLYPIANYASALLAAGNSAKIVNVGRESLTRVQRGPRIGIPGAPDDVPPTTALLSGERAVCLPKGSGTLLVDLDPEGRARPVPRNRWILLTGPDRAMYVVWNGKKFRLRSRAELVALGLVAHRPVTASAAWLAGLRSGTTLRAAQIRRSGSAGPSVAGDSSKVGQLFETTAAGARELYVMLSDGLVSVNRTEFALLSAVSGAEPPKQVSAADIASAPVSQVSSLRPATPDLLSGAAFRPGGSSLCVLQKAGSSAGGSVVTEAVAAGPRTSGLVVPPGRGMLAQAQTASQSVDDSPQLYLITNTGMKYPLAGDTTVQALGYGQAAVRGLPQRLLDLAPTGPTLSPAAARAADVTSAG